MNCLYSHSLTDADLELTLASLVARGFLNCRVGKIWRIETRDYVDGKIYTMTDSGGYLWEHERLPDGDRYVATSRWMSGTDNREMIRIVCQTEEIGRLYLGAMFAAGLIAPSGRIRVRDVWDVRLLPWKTFGRVKSIRCKTCDNENDDIYPTHLEIYNANRCWWQDIAELETLNKDNR
jgi:hypothetical protein